MCRFLLSGLELILYILSVPSIFLHILCFVFPYSWIKLYQVYVTQFHFSLLVDRQKSWFCCLTIVYTAAINEVLRYFFRNICPECYISRFADFVSHQPWYSTMQPRYSWTRSKLGFCGFSTVLCPQFTIWVSIFVCALSPKKRLSYTNMSMTICFLVLLFVRIYFSCALTVK